MRIDCLGSGSAFSGGRYWSGFLLDGTVLLDCPPQTLVHLLRLGRHPAELSAVLLSHDHFDHIGGMDPLLLELTRGAGFGPHPLTVLAPPGVRARVRAIVGERSSRLPPPDDPRLRWVEVRGGDAHLLPDGTRVEVHTAVHRPDRPAVGYRVRSGRCTVAYSGDTAAGPHLEALGDGADVLIVECGGDRSSGHMEWEDIGALRAALDPRTRMLVTHYDPRETPAALPPGVELAEDFAVYTASPGNR